ncbi:MAG: hypothetical protein HQM12_21630 [SAR324 cluster bacterium]|nr:hypothetical protein [SAR324 cluster bacterium]
MNDQTSKNIIEQLEKRLQRIEQDEKKKRWFHLPSTILGITICSVFLAILSYADTPSSISRTDFKSGTVISSSTINSQFNTVYSAVNELLGKIQTVGNSLNITGNPAVTGNMSVSGTLSGGTISSDSYKIPQRDYKIIIKTNTTNPTYQVDITADFLTVYDSNNITKVLSNVSSTVDITVSGANGLDTGSEAANSWYFIWVIWNGTTTASLLSASSTAPTMPSGYTHNRLVGAVHNTGTDFLPFIQQDNHVIVPKDETGNTPGMYVLRAFSSDTTLTGTDISTYVPPIVIALSLVIDVVGNTSVSGCFLSFNNNQANEYMAAYSGSSDNYSAVLHDIEYGSTNLYSRSHGGGSGGINIHLRGYVYRLF